MDYGIFIFRRDYRLYDNIGLNKLSEVTKHISPIFIFDPKQIDRNNNPYFSDNCVQFMIESLLELDEDLKNKHNSGISFMHGNPTDVLTKIHKKRPFKYLAFNMDVTPYSKDRDNLIEQWCKNNNVECIISSDTTILPLSSVKTKSNEIYKVYTPYFNTASAIETPKPASLPSGITFEKPMKDGLKLKDLNKLYIPNNNVAVRGGRTNGLKILNHLDAFKNYDTDRDSPFLKNTMLSAYLKFGCVSIREFKEAIVSKLGKSNGLFKQIYWREFYYNIAYNFPHVFGSAFKEHYASLKWDNNKEWFELWKTGNTGCPFVDAGMRELNETGFMHNRLRMVVSMFLTKDLLIDWRWGEKYFATKLVDYDPANNNGGWQWSASTGTDSQPYFRIFNPYTMMLRLDPKGEYTKKWLPELKDVPMKDLSNWETEYKKYPQIKYVKPVVSHSEQRLKALDLYKR